MREEGSCQVHEASGIQRIPGEPFGQAAPRSTSGWGSGYDALFDSPESEPLDQAGGERHQEISGERSRVIVCAVCQRPHVARSSRSRTCSPECASFYPRVRYHLDSEARDAHRMAQAKVITANPSRYKESQVSWAMRMLSDSPPPPNRSFTKKGSSVERLLRKVDRVRRSVARDIKREQP
jgi:hypothetical protein